MLRERNLREHIGYLESTMVNAAMSMAVSVGPHSPFGGRTIDVTAQVRWLAGSRWRKLVSIVTTIDMLKAFFGVIECLERSCSS